MRHIIVFLLLLVLTSKAYAQITVTGDDFISSFWNPSVPVASWSSNDTNGLRALDILNGVGKTWDFTTRAYTLDFSGSGIRNSIPYSTDLPLATDPDFSTANQVSVDSKGPGWLIYTYDRIDSSGYWNLGQSQDSLGVISKVERYVPPFLQFKFPLTYLTTWTSSSMYYNLKYGDTISERVEGAVDGYGTLQLPSSPGQAALRVVMRFTDAYNGYPPTTDNNFFWFTKSPYWALIQSDDTLKPRSVGYFQPVDNAGVAQSLLSSNALGLDLHLASAPAGTTSLVYRLPQSGPVQISLMDLLGRTVHLLHNGFAPAGENEIDINPKRVAPGTYFIRVQAGEKSQIGKVVIAR